MIEGGRESSRIVRNQDLDRRREKGREGEEVIKTTWKETGKREELQVTGREN